MTGRTFLGIDFGTSGVRAILIDGAGEVVAQASRPLPAPEEAEDGGRFQDPDVWWQALCQLLAELRTRDRLEQLAALAVDGTSGTLLLADEVGRPLGPARLYNDRGCGLEVERIAAVAPPESGAHGSGSALARLLRMQEAPKAGEARFALHQADWIAARLSGQLGLSDENNALKLGYDPLERRWPEWLEELAVRRDLLPRPLEPGEAIAPLDPDVAAELGLPRKALVVAGTTDGCAAFLATGAWEVGDAVTSLGSTLVVKLLSDRPNFAPEAGVYSHRLGDRWLVGGASNSGGDALRRFFTPEEMAALEPELDPERPTGLDFYPLPHPGERFPVNDPQLRPKVEPRPKEDARFYQALLEGVAEVEATAYARLAELGAPPLASLRTVGRGAAIEAWTRIRERRLGFRFKPARHQEAAYGTALLARRGAGA